MRKHLLPHLIGVTGERLTDVVCHNTGHEGSHSFLTHEFIYALLHRPPIIDLYEALEYTVPGIVARQSALKKGNQLKIPQYKPL